MREKILPVVICDNCKEEFEWTRGSYHFRVSEHKFCNNACYY